MIKIEDNGASLRGDHRGDRLLSRRRFLSTVLAGAATAYAAPSLLDCFRRKTSLIAEAAELSREAVTVVPALSSQSGRRQKIG
jgi:hypothetical protein